jgi:hypothetical protein
MLSIATVCVSACVYPTRKQESRLVSLVVQGSIWEGQVDFLLRWDNLRLCVGMTRKVGNILLACNQTQ